MECGMYHYERWRSLLDEFCALMGNYAAYGGNSLPTFRVNLSAPVFRGSRSFFCSFWILEPLKMGPIGCPETSARYYHHTLRNVPKLRQGITITRCVMAQKSVDIIYIYAAEAWNHGSSLDVSCGANLNILISEVWVLKKREEQRLEAAQMKFLRHLLGITKLDKEKDQCIRQKNKFSLRLYCWRCRIHLQQQQYTLFIVFLQLTWNGQA